MAGQGWIGDVAAALALADPSGQGAKSFANSLSQQQNQNSGDDDDTPKPKGKKGVAPPITATPVAAPAPGGWDNVVPPTATPQAPPAPGALAPALVPGAGPAPVPGQQTVQPPVPVTPSVAPTAPALKPGIAAAVGAPMPPAVSRPPAGMPVPLAQVFSQPAPWDGGPKSAPDALSEIAQDEDVWGNGQESPNITNFANSLKVNGMNAPQTAQSFRAALPDLRAYAQHPLADSDGKNYARSILHAYGQVLTGQGGG